MSVSVTHRNGKVVISGSRPEGIGVMPQVVVIDNSYPHEARKLAAQLVAAADEAEAYMRSIERKRFDELLAKREALDAEIREYERRLASAQEAQA